MLTVVVPPGASAPGEAVARLTNLSGPMMPSLRHRLQIPVLAGGLAVAIGAGLVFNPPSGADAFGTLGRAEAAASSPSPAAPGLAFPGVEGVDLVALGYRGVDLDAVSVAALDTPLPELPMERAAEIRTRIEVGAAHVEGLRGAEYVLYETARSMKRDVKDAVAALEDAAKAQAKAEKRLTQVRAEMDQKRVLLAKQPALDVGDGITDAVLNAAELEALAAHHAQDVAEAQVIEREARRQAHRTALDLAHREGNRMDDHIEYLYNELRQARAGMLAAGRWLAEEERGREDLPIVTVEGFRVHASIAGSLRDMVVAARADGIDLRGKGYRSTQRQIELRKQNCGPTEDDIYNKPSGQCSPPTAKPHRSLHESGLAVDFRYGEESITTRSSPAYRWLAQNAAAYGFFNLPSEPWHWSVSAG